MSAAGMETQVESTRIPKWKAVKRLTAEGKYEAFKVRALHHRKKHKLDREEAFYAALAEFPEETLSGE